MLPAILKRFAVYGDGKSYMGEIAQITLPKLGRKVEEWQGAGMIGPVELDLGQEMLSAELTAGGLMVDVLGNYAAKKVDGVMLRFAGAYRSDDETKPYAVEIVMRGRYKEIDMGEAKQGEQGSQKYAFSISYYKLTIDGQERIELDMVNGIEKINGVDNLAAERLAIGAA